MPEEFKLVDIWVGKFTSKKALTAYLESNYTKDDLTNCGFAIEQGIDHLDEDMLESSFRRSTANFRKLVESHSYAESFLQAAEASFQDTGIGSANSIVLHFGGEIESPRSVESNEFRLRYLGRFPVEPKSMALGDDGPPSQIFLILEDRELFFENANRKVICVGPKGLCIGKRSEDSNIPLLDLTAVVPDIADVQVQIYLDQFDQWVLEDVAGNGLTHMNGEPLSKERTLPGKGEVSPSDLSRLSGRFARPERSRSTNFRNGFLSAIRNAIKPIVILLLDKLNSNSFTTH